MNYQCKASDVKRQKTDLNGKNNNKTVKIRLFNRNLAKQKREGFLIIIWEIYVLKREIQPRPRKRSHKKTCNLMSIPALNYTFGLYNQNTENSCLRNGKCKYRELVAGTVRSGLNPDGMGTLLGEFL